jgi:hypothetical protein
MNRVRTRTAVCALGVVGAISAACFFFWPASIEAVQATNAQPTGSALVMKGEYLTKAADCAASRGRAVCRRARLQTSVRHDLFD